VACEHGHNSFKANATAPYLAPRPQVPRMDDCDISTIATTTPPRRCARLVRSLHAQFGGETSEPLPCQVIEIRTHSLILSYAGWLMLSSTRGFPQ
jgi:hypothetical protein